MAKLQEITKIVAALKAYYPNYNPLDPGATALALVPLFGDLPYELIETALFALCAEPREFAPSAGQIRRRVFELQARAQGITEAWQAYEEVCGMPANMLVCERLEQIGDACRPLYRKLEWSSPLVAETAALMGWPERFPTERPEADRAQFLQAYNAALNRYLGEAAEPALVRQFIEQGRAARTLPGAQEAA